MKHGSLLFPRCCSVEDQQREETKVEQVHSTPAPLRKEAPLVSETRAQDAVPPPTTSGKKKNSAKKQKAESGGWRCALRSLSHTQTQTDRPTDR